ncbi:MAG: hypothetical protein GWO07_07760 [Candidatus Dadabacteria bacterium]|nr:hypothetical protein [Candidatus Dadabacteria bacterium]NIS08640.1 hypothetical protein [Candidatus Dadabacteria bacterium]NIV42474.1 hypothetical protein [Candidatus Dadabacteria bacterium]NIX15356.1 hypothetical protein [Candidatus Dadabacteria bacterium]NIY22015.1 hypothetical protein [Candidatus Dadabacteria bacterium]
MEIENVYQIAKREWDNIRISLRSCGNIPNLDFNSFITSKPNLISSLNEMDFKIIKYDYTTKEAGYVFYELVTHAAGRLGLNGKTAKIFGSSYSWVRTGWYSPVLLNYKSKKSINQCIRKQVVFYKIFFPVNEDYNWDFDCPTVNSKFKTIFEKFINWQYEPGLYSKEMFIYRTQVDNVLEGINLALDEHIGSC